MQPNPMQVILRRQMGLDVFALDGDDTDVQDTWQDDPRRRGPASPRAAKGNAGGSKGQ
jgi:hypothetical protein